MKTLTTIGIILLSGCASHPVLWDKAGATPLTFAQDRYACQQETAGSGAYSAGGSLMFIAMAQAQAKKNLKAMFQSCMEARGYTLER